MSSILTAALLDSILVPMGSPINLLDFLFWPQHNIMAMTMQNKSFSSPSSFSALNTSNTTSNSNLITYENSTAGIKIDYPSDWTRRQGLENTTIAYISPQMSVLL